MVKKEYEKDCWTLDAKQALQFDQPKDNSISSITLKVLEPEDITQKNWLIHLLGGGMVSVAILLLQFRCIFSNVFSLITKRYQGR